MEFAIVWSLVTLVGSFGGAWFGAYFKKKGENYATKEDLGGLVQQVQAVTRATEEIKAKISDEVWDRQRRWELKRDVLVDAMRKAGTMMDALTTLHSFYQTTASMAGENLPSRIAVHTEKAEASNNSGAEFDAATLVAGLVCGEKVRTLMRELGLLVTRTHGEILSEQTDTFQKSVPELVVKLRDLTVEVRKELGVDDAS